MTRPVESPRLYQLPSPAGSIESQPGGHLAAFTAFGILHVPILAAGNKNVRGKRVVFGFHRRKLGLNVTYRRNELFSASSAASLAWLFI